MAHRSQEILRGVNGSILGSEFLYVEGNLSATMARLLAILKCQRPLVEVFYGQLPRVAFFIVRLSSKCAFPKSGTG